MKIAVVEWWPRVNGATDYGSHLMGGAAKHGVEMTKVTFSKSGKVLKPWERADEYQVHRLRDAPDVLNEFDHIILTDLVCFAPQIHKKGVEIPYFVETMRQTSTPWSTIFHGNDYPKKYDPTIAEMLALPNFSGVVAVRPTKGREQLGRFGHRLRYVENTRLPYDPARAAGVRIPKRRRRSVMMTGRLMSNKGQDTALDIFSELHGHLDIWGYNAFGLPSIGWRLWELGNALGYEVMRTYTPDGRPALRRGSETLKHPNAHRFYTGRFQFRRGRRFATYHDGYSQLSEVNWAPWIHISLANDSYYGIEYSTLDAVFVEGCVIAVPSHALERTPYETIISLPFERGSASSRADGTVRRTFSGDRGRLISTLNRCLQAHEIDLGSVQRDQRAEIGELHDPAINLGQILGAIPTRRRRRAKLKEEAPMPKKNLGRTGRPYATTLARTIALGAIRPRVKPSSTVLVVGGDGSFAAYIGEFPKRTPASYDCLSTKALNGVPDFTWAHFGHVKDLVKALDDVADATVVICLEAIAAAPSKVARKKLLKAMARRLADAGTMFIGVDEAILSSRAAFSAEMEKLDLEVVDLIGVEADFRDLRSEADSTDKRLLREIAKRYDEPTAAALLAIAYPDASSRAILVVRFAGAEELPTIAPMTRPKTTGGTKTGRTAAEPKLSKPPRAVQSDAVKDAAKVGKARMHQREPQQSAKTGKVTRAAARAATKRSTTPASTAKSSNGATTSAALIRERLAVGEFGSDRRPPDEWCEALAQEVRERFSTPERPRTTKKSDVLFVWRQL